jgi:hypothetical protein
MQLAVFTFAGQPEIPSQRDTRSVRLARDRSDAAVMSGIHPNLLLTYGITCLVMRFFNSHNQQDPALQHSISHHLRSRFEMLKGSNDSFVMSDASPT